MTITSEKVFLVLELITVVTFCHAVTFKLIYFICFYEEIFTFSNNNVQDGGMKFITDGLYEQSTQAETGLGVLVVWNNHLTLNSSHYIAKILVSTYLLFYCSLPCCIVFLCYFMFNVIAVPWDSIVEL